MSSEAGMNIYRLATPIIVTIVLAGCAAAPTAPELERDAVPTSGRYTVVMRDTGRITMMKVGTLTFASSNPMHRVAVSNSISERMRSSIIETLSKSTALEYVPSEMTLEFVHPRYLINPYDISFSVQYDERTHTQESVLTTTLTDLTRKLDLDLVVVVNEWGSSDYVSSSKQPLVGHGVYFKAPPLSALRELAVYTAYQIRLFDPKTGLFRNARGMSCNKLDKSRWMEIDWNEPPKLEVVKSFLPDVESTVPPADLEANLFALGLLQTKPKSSGFNLISIERC
jgi:hypothetical protein